MYVCVILDSSSDTISYRHKKHYAQFSSREAQKPTKQSSVLDDLRLQNNFDSSPSMNTPIDLTASSENRAGDI